MRPNSGHQRSSPLSAFSNTRMLAGRGGRSLETMWSELRSVSMFTCPLHCHTAETSWPEPIRLIARELLCGLTRGKLTVPQQEWKTQVGYVRRSALVVRSLTRITPSVAELEDAYQTKKPAAQNPDWCPHQTPTGRLSLTRARKLAISSSRASTPCRFWTAIVQPVLQIPIAR